MRLTVLGSAASYAGASHACSGYLIESGDTTVMLDCGNGTIANASALIDVTSLDAVLVSHMHTDHFLDLYALQAALRFAPDGPIGSLPIHLPEGLWERMKALLDESGAVHLEESFEPHVLRDGHKVEFGGVTVTPRQVDHDGPTFAFIVEGDDATIAYTADTRDGEAVRKAVAGCDVLVAECTMPKEYAGKAPHLSAAEAASIGNEAGADVLMLTHLWPTADHQRMLAEAAAIFDGQVMLADEILTIETAPSSAMRGL